MFVSKWYVSGQIGCFASQARVKLLLHIMDSFYYFFNQNAIRGMHKATYGG